MALFAVVERHAATAGGAAIAAYDAGHAEVDVLPAELSYAALRAAAEKLSDALGVRLAASGRGTPDGFAVVATCMRRGNDWYAVFCAAARLLAPLVALSADLPDGATEQRRNQEILLEHRPAVVVVDDAWQRAGVGAAATEAGCCVVHFTELWAQAPREEGAALEWWWVDAGQRPEDAMLCFCYTGGTTGASRCARVTHGMALHEVDAYPRILDMSSTDRVLQQHSVYWAASAYGELDIALAFGCAVVFCTAWGAEDVASVVRTSGATCAGLVPSVLAALDPADLPSLRVVFTWGEALQVRSALEWATRVHLVDLLISTEYWLALYADWTAFARLGGGGARPAFRTVEGAKVRLRRVCEDGAGAVGVDEASGELLVSGPMVTPGYTDPERTSAVLIRDEGGEAWYCTRDCLERRPGGGLAFVGRADDLVKVGGVWVDVRDVERRLEAVDGVAQARIFSRDAFVVLRDGHSEALPTLRRELPVGFGLFVVPRMPLRAGTEKVDRQRLAALVSPDLDPPHRDVAAERYDGQLAELRWWYWPCALLLVLPMLHTLSALHGVLASGLTAASAAECLIELFVAFPLQVLLRAFCLSYLLLLPVYHTTIYSKLQHFPLGHVGLVVAASALLPRAALVVVAAPAAIKAASRDRLLSWPVVCAVGFPLWARETGQWWVQSRASHIGRWYAHELRKVLGCDRFRCDRRPMANFLATLATQASRPIGCSRVCKECRRMFHRWAGHVDLSVDEGWYCEPCWQLYHRHRMCGLCKRWVTMGSNDATSESGWICTRCERRRSEQQDALSDAPPSPPFATPADVAAGQQASADAGDRVSPGAEAADSPELAAGVVAETADSAPELADSAAAAAPAAETLDSAPEPADSAAGAAPADSAPEPADSAAGVAPAAEGPPPADSAADSAAGAAPAADSAAGDAAAGADVAPAVGVVSPSAADMAAGGADAGRGRGDPSERPEYRTIAVNFQRPADCGLVPAPADGEAPAVAKSREWLLVERATGMTFPTRAERIGGLDSLRTTKLASALQREVGVRLARGELKACDTLGDLLDAIAKAPPDAVKKQGELPAVAYSEHAAWGMMWKSKCSWTLLRDRPLPREVLEEALGQLIERHAALRAEFADPMQFFSAIQPVLSVFELWRLRGCPSRRRPAAAARSSWGVLGGLAASLGGAAERLVCWALRQAWPRLGCRARGPEALRAAVAAALVEMPQRRTMHDAKWARCPAFEPPLQVVMASYGEGEPEGVVVHLSVSHMFSDGYSIVPLLSDLAHLVARAEALRAAGRAGGEVAAGVNVPPPLPPLPNVLATLERRIFSTIRRDLSDSVVTLGGIPGWRHVQRRSATVYADVPAEIVSTIRAAAMRLGVPDDLVLLAAVGTSIARFREEETTAICMVVPQRDLPGESDMVGLVADMRVLEIRTGGLSYLGTLMQVAHVVRERLWHPPPPMAMAEFPFVNFEWTDFESRHGFRQEPYQSSGIEHLQGPMSIAVDQPDPTRWRIRAAFDMNTLDHNASDRYFAIFQDCLRAVLEDPLELVWSGGGGAGPRRAA